MKRDDDDFDDFEFEDEEAYEKPIKKRIYEDLKEDEAFDDSPPYDEYLKPKAKPKTSYGHTKGERAHISEKKTTEQKYQYRVFLLLTICVGFVVFILTMMTVFRVMEKNKQSNGDNQPSSTSDISTAESSASTDAQDGKLVEGAMIADILFGSKLKFYQLSTAGILELNLNNKTEIKNKYNNSIGIGELSEGDVVNITYDEATSNLLTISISSEAWNQDSITGAYVNSSENTIQISNKVYRYNSQVICLNKGQKFDINSITSADTITVKGYQGNVVYVEVIKGHGSIAIMNKDNIINGILEVEGMNIYKNLNEAEDTYDLPEGVHKIKITGDNIKDHIQNINVKEGATQYIDLGEVESKQGQLIVRANVDGILTIDGTEYPLNGPIELPLGVYTVRLEKDGYGTEEKTVELDSLQKTVTFELKETIKVAKLIVTSEPYGSDVYVDNVYIGVTPLETTIGYGYHKILIRKAGYVDIDAPIMVTEPVHEINNPLYYDYSTNQSASEATPSDALTGPELPIIDE